MEKETLRLLRFVSDSRETGLDPVSDKGKNQGFSGTQSHGKKWGQGLGI